MRFLLASAHGSRGGESRYYVLVHQPLVPDMTLYRSNARGQIEDLADVVACGQTLEDVLSAFAVYVAAQLSLVPTDVVPTSLLSTVRPTYIAQADGFLRHRARPISSPQ